MMKVAQAGHIMDQALSIIRRRPVVQRRWRVDIIWRVGVIIELEAESAQAAEQLAYALDPRDLEDPEPDIAISSVTILARD